MSAIRPMAVHADAQTPTFAQSEQAVQQLTFSAIGDLGVAASAMPAAVEPARQSAWKRGAAFWGALVVVVLLLTAWFGGGWQMALTGGLACVAAGWAFWLREHALVAAARAQAANKTTQAASHSLMHECANAVNGIRAQLAALKLEGASDQASHHLEEIESATQRIQTALEVAIRRE